MSHTLILSAGHQLRDQAEPLAAAAVALEFGQRPDLRSRYGLVGRQHSMQAVQCTVRHLAEAVDLESPALFEHHVAWAKVTLGHRGVSAEGLAHRLNCLADVLVERMPAAVSAPAGELLRRALHALSGMPDDAPSALDAQSPLGLLAHQYTRALLGGFRAAASRLAFEAFERGEPLGALYVRVFQPALYEIGRLWQINRISVAQEHFCSAATQMAMAQLMARAPSPRPAGRRILVACVAEESHDLGARMVADCFEMAGWDTYYCGASTPHDALVHALQEKRTDILGVSVTRADQLHEAKALIDAVRAEPACRNLALMVGGQPFCVDPSLWRRVGADGTAPTADAAVAVAAQWQSAEPRPT